MAASQNIPVLCSKWETGLNFIFVPEKKFFSLHFRHLVDLSCSKNVRKQNENYLLWRENCQKRQYIRATKWETKGAAIAQWIRLRLPSCCGPGFEFRAHHLPMLVYSHILFCICHWIEKRTKLIKKRPGFDPTIITGAVPSLIPGNSFQV